LFEWDGNGLRRIDAGEAAVAIDAALPDGLARLLRLWARSRALRPVAADAPAASLRVTSSASAAPPVRVVVGRDGWRMALEVCGAGALDFDDQGRRLEPWLSAGSEDPSALRSLVSFRPGRIDVALCPGAGAMDTPFQDAPDPAAFAVSWARLFDACLLPAPGVVPLAERLDAGAAERSARAPDALPEARLDESPAALLAALAALATSCAIGLGSLSAREVDK
jgi:hypothetical protein